MFGLQTFAVIFLIVGVNSAPAYKANNGCSVEGIPPDDFMSFHRNKESFKEDYSGVVAEYPVGDITDVYVDEGTYLAASIKNDKIIIETTDNFQNFEKDKGPMDGSITFPTYIIFECINGSSRLDFQQRVIDINNNDPYFNKKNFEFKYGTSLLKGFELTRYFTVAGMDDDLTQARVEFEIADDLFKIKEGPSVDRGNLAAIILQKDIEMPFDREFDLTVIDQGMEPYRSTTVKLRLVLTGSDNLVVSPLFAKPLLIWQYDKTLKSIIGLEPVSLKQGFGTGLTIKQTGYEDYFETTLDLEEEQVKIELKKALTEEIIEEKRLFLNLEAELPGAKQIAKTTIMIEMV